MWGNKEGTNGGERGGKMRGEGKKKWMTTKDEDDYDDNDDDNDN